MTAELIHRLHFAFTITFHYLFPQLTMGLALLIVVLKSVALKTGSEQWDRAARFWGRIFGINFVFGVVTGIPMEFEFGTNWARFSRLSGGVIGQPLAMEGVFSFFLESAFLGLFLYGEKRISKLDALVLGRHGLRRLVDLRLLHHRHRRVDAAPRGLRPPAQRPV
jgi:cytochrome bd ubiquinol oxidase subunit I